jgi:hypothetical protein
MDLHIHGHIEIDYVMYFLGGMGVGVCTQWPL